MNNPGFKRGLFYGVSAIGLFLVVYLINKRMIFSPGFGPIVSLVIPVIFMVLAARDTRNHQEGYMSFGEALSSTFLTYVIGSFLYTSFSYIMTNIVDPSLLEIGKEVALEAMDKLSAIMGEDQIDVMKDAIEDSTDGAGIGSNLFGWAFSLIIPGFIIAAIISAITKRNHVA